MNDNFPKQAQARAHKKNLGALKFLDSFVEQMQKDQKKVLQNIDHEVMDAHKFLDQIQRSTGNSVTYAEAFSTPHGGTRDEGHDAVEKCRPTKSSVMKTEVKLRKALAEARFKVRSSEFFRKWDEAFQLDLSLDDWLIMQGRSQSNGVEDDWWNSRLEEETP